MIIKNNKVTSALYKGAKEILKRYKGTLVVYEAFKKLIASGVPPITLQKCKKTDLLDYKIYGNSKQGELPQEYQQVEYIENTGTQYINTGVIPTSDTSVELIYQSLSYTGTSQYIMGSREGISGAIYYAFNGAGGRTDWDIRIKGNAIFSDVQRTNDKYKSKISLVDGKGEWALTNLNTLETNTFAIDTTPFTAVEPLCLFAYNNLQIHTNLRIYECKIYEKTKLVRHFIPCYRSSDNVIGMYDLVTNTFYENSGGKTFLKGNNIVTPTNPIEIESVGGKTKNILYGGDRNNTNLPLTVKIKGSELTLNGTSTTNTSLSYSEDNSFILKPGTYTLSVSYISGKVNSMEKPSYFGLRTATETWTSSSTFEINASNYKTGNKKTFTIETEKRVCLGYVGSGDIDNLILGVQLEEGSVRTAYEPYGYKIPVKVSGKNLLNITDIEVGSPTVTINCNLTKDLIVSCQEYPSSIIHSTTGAETSIWRLSFTQLDGTMQYIVDNALKKLGTYVNTIKATEENPVVSITYRSTYIKEGAYKGIQIEYGNAITDYQPYVEPIITNIYLKEPLMKIGDYADYIDFEKGQVVRNVGKYVLTSSSNWTPASVMDDGTYRVYIGYGANSPIQEGVKNLLLCNCFTYSAWARRATLGEMNKIFVGSDMADSTAMGIQVRIDSSIAKSLAEFKAFLDSLEVPLMLYNPYSSPKLETIELPNILMNKGTNIIEVDTTIQPSNMEVTYLGKK